MKRIINNSNELVDDMIAGFLRAHRRRVAPTDNPRVVKYCEAPVAGKVGLVTGGGSGHKPAFIGYLGKNMIDAVAVGEIFSSPSAKAFFDAFRVADSGVGVACLFGNYAGDTMNVKLAIELAEEEGIRVKTVVANDDVPSAPKREQAKRRGVAGEVLMWKVGAAKAAEGADLDSVIAAAQKTIDNTRSIGIGLTPCTIPAVGHPNFTIEAGKMEVGIGHHGEPGIRVETLKPASEIAKLMLDVILPDLPFTKGDEVVALVSGLGATPAMELYVLYDTVERLLDAAGITVYRPYVGNYFTSLEMMGVTLTLMKLDSELKRLIDLPADSIGLMQF
ncbi:MAG TPA: dihydroxyacetone kinase subunit DhaK [Spirochaetia bacterium]|nr:dihydroxyacetone kinase subunit DhaK [Spirochaetia bacterium]